MSKMGTKNGKGRKRFAVFALLLAVVLLVGAIGGVSAAAAESSNFDLTVKNGVVEDNGLSWPFRQQWVTAEYSASTTESFNLFTDKLLTVNNMGRVKAIKFTLAGMDNIYSDMHMVVNTEGEESKWKGVSNDAENKGWATGKEVVYHKDTGTINAGDFRAALNRISVIFDSEFNSAYGTMTITAYSNSGATTQIKTPYTKYVLAFRFYSYAEGAISGKPVVDYRGDYDADFDQTGANGRVPVEPADLKNGKVDLKMKFTTFGGINGTRKVQYGYQVKKSSETWSGAKTYLYPGEIETATWTNMNKTVDLSIPMDGEYLEAGTPYSIRGIVVSDGKTESPKATDELTVQYQKPRINSFNVGSTAQIWKGGDLMSISALGVFADTNAIDTTTSNATPLTYTGADGEEYPGPVVRVKLYFTPDRKFATVTEAGEEVQYDEATWYEIDTQDMALMSDNGDGTYKIATTVDYSFNNKLPQRLSELDSTITGENDRWINSKNCAYKLVFTDMKTGYSVYTYSNPFTVDSTNPENLTVTGHTADGFEVDLELKADMRPSGATTLTIGEVNDDTNAVYPKQEGGSYVSAALAVPDEIRTDADGNPIGLGKGSGVKEYSYSMYYLSSSAVAVNSELKTMTVAQVLQKMSTFDKNSAGVEYTDWTSLTMTDNQATLAMAKDGYYRVDIKATDNSGKDTEIQKKYLRVDLTSPSKPKAALAVQKADGTFAPYDNRSYSSETVWLFAYSDPLTGKTLQNFEYTTDGGLTWKGVTSKNEDGSMQIHHTLKKIPFVETDEDGSVKFNKQGRVTPTVEINAEGKEEQGFETVSVYDYAANNYTTAVDFKYNAAVNLTGMGLGDYLSIQVRGTDDLGNTSALSDPVVMRTVAQVPEASGSLSHDTIEVAIATGKISGFDTKTITSYLKNATALKLNAKFFGTSSDAYKKIENHVCVWYGTDGQPDVSCVGQHGGACEDANCPYKLYGEQYDYYTPEEVKVSGLSSENAADSKFAWTRYDHSMFNRIKDNKGVVHQIATAAYTHDTLDATTLKGNTKYDMTEANDKQYATASTDRVMYLGQYTTRRTSDGVHQDANGQYPYDDQDNVNGVADQVIGGFPLRDKYDKYTSNRSFVWERGTSSTDPLRNGFPANGTIIPVIYERDAAGNDTNRLLINNRTLQPVNATQYTYNFVMPLDTYNQMGHYYKENCNPVYCGALSQGASGDGRTGQPANNVWGWAEASIAKRIYHLVDMSTAGDTIPERIDGYVNMEDYGKGDMSVISLYNGISMGNPRDWLFLYNDDPTEKEISFTINDTNANAHSSDFHGFLFNTTIRQSTTRTDPEGKPSWRISGYLFMNGNVGEYMVGVPNYPLAYKLWILKLDDIDMEQFADGVLNTNGGANNRPSSGDGNSPDELALYLSNDSALNNNTSTDYWHTSFNPLPGGGRITTVAYSLLDVRDGPYVRNYKLVVDDSTMKMYMYNSGDGRNVANVLSAAELDEVWNKSQAAIAAGTLTPTIMTGEKRNDTYYVPIRWYKNRFEYQKDIWQKYRGADGVHIFASGDTFIDIDNREISATTRNDSTAPQIWPTEVVEIPTPMVDGVQVGSRAANNAGIHKDQNTYGFGPICGPRSYHCGCTIDSRAVFTHIRMKLLSTKTLSEVLAQPTWGESESKFIVNLSDNSVDDFHDPILATTVQEKMNTEKVKLVGWGKQVNQAETVSFLSRIEGSGTYVLTDNASLPYVKKNGNDVDLDAENTQIDEVVNYITTTYFDNLGFDGSSDTPIVEQAVTASQKKGAVYTLENVKNVNFSVVSPAGQDYNTTTANPDFPSGRWYMIHDTLGYQAEVNPMSGKFSDALSLNGLTQPGRYTVYFAPTMRTLEDGVTKVVDESRLNPEDAVFDFVVHQRPTATFGGTVNQETGLITINENSEDPDTPDGDAIPNSNSKTYTINGVEKTYNSCQLNGIVKREWKWEILRKIYLDASGNKVDSDSVNLDHTDMETVYSSGNAWVEDNNLNDNKGACPNGQTISQLTGGGMNKLGADDILTVYERVTDVTSRRVAYNAAGKKCEPGDSVAEYRYEQIPATDQTMNVSEVCLLNLSVGVTVTNTANADCSTSRVNIYDTATGDTGTFTIERKSKQNQGKPDEEWKCDWSISLTGEKKDAVPLTEDANHNWSYNGTMIMKNIVPPSETGNEAAGKWEVSKSAMATLLGNKAGSVIFVLKESVWGISAENLKLHPYNAQPAWIESDTTRTINYVKDTTAPTAQVIDLSTKYPAATGKPDGEYLASSYLDVTDLNTAGFVNLHVGSSKDNEGAVKGYAYYFYDKNTAGAEAKWYYMDANGVLQNAGSKANAIKQSMAGGSAGVILGDAGGDIQVTGRIMTEDRRPTYAANVAVFAYDTQTGMPTDTGANEASVTRVEGIKFSTSIPARPAVKVTNTTNGTVAAIGNEYAFYNYNDHVMNGAQPAYDAGTGAYSTASTGTDKPVSDMNFAANTNVTLQFTPSQRTYAAAEDNTLYPSEGAGANQYYQDIYGRADLTGSNTVYYTIWHRERTTDEYQIYTMNGDRQEEVAISPSVNVTLTEDGQYKVTARVKNGSGTFSETTQPIEFFVDQTAPTGMRVNFENTGSDTVEEYISGKPAKQVTMTVSGATGEVNLDGCGYMYSVDNGATWKYMGNNEDSTAISGTGTPTGLGTQTAVFGGKTVMGRDSLYQTGEWQVRVKAVDKAGNEHLYTDRYGNVLTTTVVLDNQKPTVGAPEVKSESVTNSYYGECVYTLGSSTGHGQVRAMNTDGTDNLTDDTIFVPTDGTMRFYVMPDEGYVVSKVTVSQKINGQLVVNELSGDDLKADPAHGKNHYYYVAQNVRYDATINAEFAPEGGEAVAVSEMSAAPMRFFSARTLKEQQPVEAAMSAALSAARESVSADSGIAPLADEPINTTLEINFTGNGSVTTNPSGDQVPVGQDILCTMKPGSSNYELSSLIVNGTEVVSSATWDSTTRAYTYTIPGSQVTSAGVTVDATFSKIIRRTVTLSKVAGGEGSLSLSGGERDVIDNGNGSYSVRAGSTVSLTVTPDTANSFIIESLTIDGVPDANAANHTGEYSRDVTIGPAPEGEDPGVAIVAKFEVGGDPDSICTINAAVNDPTMGVIEPSGAVKILAETGTRTFCIYPNPGYKIEKVTVAQAKEDEVISQDQPIGSMNTVTNPVTGRAGKSYTFRGVFDDQSKIDVVFSKQTYSVVTKNVSTGGSVAITAPKLDGLNFGAIDEGTELLFQAMPNEGYKLKSLNIYTVDESGKENLIPLGMVSSYTVNYLKSNMAVSAEFEAREINLVETTHSLTAAANSVSDNRNLAEKPYRFRLKDKSGRSSAWSTWQEENNISYTYFLPEGSSTPVELQPNTLYTVEVQVMDAVGNISDPTPGTAYTAPNTPSIEMLESADSKNDDVNKNVKVYVNANGNPPDTEYLVRWSLDSNMNEKKTFDANTDEEKGIDGWATLKDGVYTVEKLTPGLKYYFLIIARNHDDQHRTPEIKANAPGIMLSPASPPACSLYFDEPASPTDGVHLYWEVPEGSEVSGIDIYRDGTWIATRPASDSGYTDNDIPLGDTFYSYSYAYANDAGTGSSRDAVSREYHDAYVGEVAYQETLKTSGEGKVTQDQLAAHNKYTKMTQLEDDTGTAIFSEVMSYPKFPKGVTLQETKITDDVKGIGDITVTVSQDSTTTARRQKYFLKLRAYERILDEAGNVTGYTDVTDTADWDRSDGDVNKTTPKETISTNSNGPTATWQGLSTDYDYRVTVVGVQSNGPLTYEEGGTGFVKDGYDGQTKGVEGTLGKFYYVDENGYHTGYGYGKKPAADIGLKVPEAGTWATNEDAKAYTGGIGWNQPLSMLNTSQTIIKFNRKPSIKPAADLYAGNGEKVKDWNGIKYLLVDQSMSDMNFHLNVVAWDEDGSPEEGMNSLLNTIIHGEAGKFTTVASLPAAADESNTYQVAFDGKSLPTGLYTDIVLQAYDGATYGKYPNEKDPDVPGMIVINRTSPIITVADGTDDRLIQSGKTYTESLLKVSSSLPAVSAEERGDLLDARLFLMADQYNEVFGTSDRNELKGLLSGEDSNTPNAEAVTKAKALLADSSGQVAAEYLAGDGLSTEGFMTALEKVSPPIKGYFELDEAKFTEYKAAASEADQKYFREETSRNGSKRYWIEQSYALNNGKCEWLAKADENGAYTVTAPSSDTLYAVELVASFGGNDSTAIVYFQVKDKPTVKIQSQKKWEWETVYADAEYEDAVASNLTIKKVIDRYKGCYDPDTTAPTEDPASPAYKEEDGVKKLYKLVDEQASAYPNELDGKITVDTGVHKAFEEIGILYQQKAWESSVTELDSLDGLPAPTRITSGGTIVTTSGNYTFQISGLSSNTNYYLRPYYKLGGKYYLSEDFVALTTEKDYELARYGFETLEDTHREREATEGGFDGTMNIPVRVLKSGSANAYGRVKLTAEYLVADQFGVVQVEKNEDGTPKKDENGNTIPVKITDPKQLEMARNTLHFTNNSDEYSVLYQYGDNDSKTVNMILSDTDEQQGHMVVRLTIAIEPDDLSKGINLLNPGRQQMDIFIQDNESAVESYLFQVDNTDGKLTEVDDSISGEFSNYEYKFDGLPADYSSGGELEVSYTNAGSGDLKNITAKVYTRKSTTSELSTEFSIAKQPDPNSLKANSNDVSYIVVSPNNHLADGTYTGWVCISASNVDETDNVWIKVTQVVGQSTLQGRIYVGVDVPSGTYADLVHTGVATVELYNYSAGWNEDGTPTEDPVYTATTNEYGGWYQINNIEDCNNQRYKIVVKRDGFLMFDGLAHTTSVTRAFSPKNSQTYEFNLRLAAGDVTSTKLSDNDFTILQGEDGQPLKDAEGNVITSGSVGDKKVNSEDQAEFERWFNMTYDMNAKPVTLDDFAIRRCDFNLDGGVNALDRALFLSYMNKTSIRNENSVYNYDDTSVIVPTLVS